MLAALHLSAWLGLADFASVCLGLCICLLSQQIQRLQPPLTGRFENRLQETVLFRPFSATPGKGKVRGVSHCRSAANDSVYILPFSFHSSQDRGTQIQEHLSVQTPTCHTSAVRDAVSPLDVSLHLQCRLFMTGLLTQKTAWQHPMFSPMRSIAVQTNTWR